jgi:hypothetical protein
MTLVRRLLPTLLACGLLGALSCDKEEENPPPPALRGRVLNAAGQPVEGLAVVAELALPYPSVAGDTLISGAMGGTSSLISFTLPEAAWIALTVHDLQSGGVLDTLAKGARPAGNHAVEWDMRDHEGLLLPADLYPIRLAANGQELGYLALVNPDHGAAPLPWHRQATTDADGFFQLERDQLPFRHDFVYTLVDEEGTGLGSYELEPTVRVQVAGSAGWLAASAVVEIPADSAAVVEITLPED